MGSSMAAGKPVPLFTAAPLSAQQLTNSILQKVGSSVSGHLSATPLSKGAGMFDRKRPRLLWIIPTVVGLAGLSRVMLSPNFALYRPVDAVQLLGSGVCFGATMVE
jgi:hypothetical protein